MNILFQCLFCSLFGIVYFLVVHGSLPQYNVILRLLYIGDYYWFVPAYLGLMVMSPVLNRFKETADKVEMKYFLVAFYLFQIVYGWLSFDQAGFKFGYSFVSFVGLYLLAGYFKLSGNLYVTKSPKIYFSWYFVITFVMSVLLLLSRIIDNEMISSMMKGKIMSYNSPLTIAAAMMFLLAFVNLKIGYSKVVNWLAASAFAIYLIHCNPLLMRDYLDLMGSLYSCFDSVLCLLVMLSAILAIGLTFILIDKIRIIIWNKINPYFT